MPVLGADLKELVFDGSETAGTGDDIQMTVAADGGFGFFLELLVFLDTTAAEGAEEMVDVP